MRRNDKMREEVNANAGNRKGLKREQKFEKQLALELSARDIE